MLSSLESLAWLGLAVHGRDDAESNLGQLLELHANDIPKFQSWLCWTLYKSVSREILNKMLDIMAHNILRSLTN